MVSATSYNNIKKEFLNELRNADLIAISDRGVTTTIENKSGDGSTVAFVLSNSGVKNIRTITVDAASKVFGTDWTFSEVAGVTTVTFTVAPSTGTNNIVITYDHSTTGDRIYPDFPMVEVNISNYPRIGFDIISSNSSEIAFTGVATQSVITVSFVAFGTNTTQTETIINGIRDLFLNKKNDLFFINFIRPQLEGPMISVEGSKNKVFQRNIDFELPFEFEI